MRVCGERAAVKTMPVGRQSFVGVCILPNMNRSARNISGLKCRRRALAAIGIKAVFPSYSVAVRARLPQTPI